MSTFSSINSSFSPNPFTRPIADPRKQPSKDVSPLQAANPEALRQSTKYTNGSTNDITSETAQARTAAEGLVSTTFIEPILKQVRESNTAPPPFGPSRAEKQFSSLLDTKLADEIVHAANFPLVDRIASQLLRNMPQVQNEVPIIDIQG
jgi:Rod binding domain-containing protein